MRAPVNPFIQATLEEQHARLAQHIRDQQTAFMQANNATTLEEARARDERGYREMVVAVAMEVAELKAALVMREAEDLQSSDSECSDISDSESPDESVELGISESEDFSASESDDDSFVAYSQEEESSGDEEIFPCSL